MTASFGSPSRVVKVRAPSASRRATPPPVDPAQTTPARSTQRVRTRKLAPLPEGSTRRKPGPSLRKSPSSSVPTQSTPRPSRARDWTLRPVRPSRGPSASKRVPVIRSRPASVRPDPEGAVLVREEGEDRARGELGCRLAIEEGEPRAVETNESLLGSDPEVAVGRLGDRLDGVLREPLPGFPAVERRVDERPGRVEGESGRTRHQNAEECGDGKRRAGAPVGAARRLSGRALRPREHWPNDKAARLPGRRARPAQLGEEVSRRGPSGPPRARSRCSAGSPAPGSG